MSRGRNERKRRTYEVRMELYRDATVCPRAVEQSYSGDRIHIPKGIPTYDPFQPDDGDFWSHEVCLFCDQGIARVITVGPNGTQFTTPWFTEPYIIELL